MECFLKSDSELGMVANKLRTTASASFRYWQIVLKKPFFGDERNFPRPLSPHLQNIHDTATRDRAVIDLQREILTAQAQQSALIENVSKLEKEVTALKAWDADKQRYELKDLWRGFFAFIPKEGMENGEPAHAICANCYQRGFKSFLQSSGHPVIHDRSWDCHACKAKIKNQSNNMGELIARCRGAPA